MYKKELFDRFFERKNESDWSYSKTFFSNEKIYNPHMELDKVTEEKDKYLTVVIVLSSVCFLTMLFLLIEVNKYHKKNED